MAHHQFDSTPNLVVRHQEIDRLYQILLMPTKRNVFLSILNPTGQVIKLFTVGQILKANADKTYYKTLRDRSGKSRKRGVRRLRRSMRMFINSQKRTKLAALRILKELIGYFRETKFCAAKEFIIWVAGANQRYIKPMISKLISLKWLRVRLILAKSSFSHNGCLRRVKKRKKNKGGRRNKWKRVGPQSGWGAPSGRGLRYGREGSYEDLLWASEWRYRARDLGGFGGSVFLETEKTER